MTESFWFYLVEIERILSLQHFSKVKNLPLRFCLLNYSVIRVILDLQPREKAAILVNSITSSWRSNSIVLLAVSFFLLRKSLEKGFLFI